MDNIDPTLTSDGFATPRRGRSNVRLILFLSIVTLPFLVGIVYPMVDYQIHGGIHHRDGYDEVDLRTLGFFVFDQANGKTEDVPARWRALDGKRIQLEGYPFSYNRSAGGMTEFEFVYNIQKCCFNGPPLVQERVYALVPPGRPAPSFEYGQLTGILHVKVRKNEVGNVASVFTLDVDGAEAKH